LKNPITALQKLDRQIPDLVGLQKLATFVKNNRHLLIFLFLAGLIAYGYDFFSFALKIDSENHAFYYGPQLAWIAQGRWGTYLLNALLLPDTVMPFIPTLIAVSGCVLGAFFFVHALSEKRGLADYLAAPIAIACPVIYFALYFTTVGYSVGVAFALSGLGVYLWKQGTGKSTVIATICFTLGIGIYQAVLPLITSLFCLQAVASIIEADNSNLDKNISLTTLLRRIFFFLLTLGVAAAISQTIGMLMMRITHVAYNAEYLSAFLTYQTTSSYFFSALQKTVNTGWDYYSGSKEFYLFDLQLLKILFVFTLTISLYRIATSKCSVMVRLAGLVLLVAAISAPLIMLMLNNGTMPPRTLLGVAYVLAGLVFLAASASGNVLRIITGVLAICCFYNFSMINNRYAFSNQMTWLADRELSIQLLDKIHVAIKKLPVKTDPFVQFPLEIVGWLEYPETPIFVHREVIGSSFYTWGAGDAERVTRLFRTMGVIDFRPASNPEKLSIVETAQHMPFWPYEGSVDIVNGIVVVKLRDYNPNQLLSMCQPPDNNNPVCLKYLPK
jgi:hypothetical protein